MESTFRTQNQSSFLEEKSILRKLARVDSDLQAALLSPSALFVPGEPAREERETITLTSFESKGLTNPRVQAKMLHDLASIELQALELGLRTLIEFPYAPEGFRQELLVITRSEGEHLSLCLKALDELGFQFGDFPAHQALWHSVSSDESLLDRVLIVHRYLEGSGLDSGETLLRRLHSVPECSMHKVVRQIVREEIGHVEFGSRWYREICQNEKIDPADDYVARMNQISMKVPRRIERISVALRKRAGFTDDEISYLEKMRLKNSKSPSRSRLEAEGGISVLDLLSAFENSSSQTSRPS